jgi:hypothetical protein
MSENTTFKICVTSPVGNKINFELTNPNQKVKGLKKDLINILSKQGEILQLSSVKLTTEDGFELVDEDCPMDLLEKNDVVKIVQKIFKIYATSPCGNKIMFELTNPN